MSNDNPFAESHFKTAKHQPDSPDRFSSLTHTRGWFHELFAWYNNNHHHQGQALFTPSDVFLGQVPEVAALRQQALDVAYNAHPERFVRGRPTAALSPGRVYIHDSSGWYRKTTPPLVGVAFLQIYVGYEWRWPRLSECVRSSVQLTQAGNRPY